jgi:TPR repeat protein
LDAQLLYAKILDEGYLCRLNSYEAFIYYTQAAKQGNTEAIYKIGYMYLEGRGIKQDYIKAYKYIAKAAEKGHHVSKSLLVAPIKESIKNIDYSKVLRMFEAVTDKGLASLEYNIGCFYESGFVDKNPRRIIEKELPRSLHWYHRAEKKNNPEAIHKLGTMYLRENFYIVISYYKKGTKLRHLDSVYELAQLYLVGNGVTKDAERAFNLFSEAANLGHPGARSVLSLLYETKATIANPFKNNSIKGMMEEVGSKGNTIVQYRFGCYYESSDNIKLAIKWYELATHGKLTDAYYRLGRIYEIKSYQNLPKAIELYEAASANYHDEATYREAQLYCYGNGIPQNYSKAFQLYTKAANLGNRTATALLDIKQVFKRNRVDNSNDTGTSNTIAIENTTLKLISEEFKELLLMHEYIARHGDVNQQYNVGYVYENGLETPDYENAFQWYSIAASSSHKDAIYRLGLLYLNGNGLPRNFTLATEFFIKAMGLGSADACYQLGLMSSSGRMTDIDYSKAEYYFILAANQGHYDAQFKLGQLYEDGYIAGKGFIDALKWYTKAFLQTSNHAILHLDELDDDPNFRTRHHSKQFHELTRYSSHQYGKFDEGNALDYEKTTGDLYYYGTNVDNNSTTLCRLGNMYHKGKGVKKVHKKSLWFPKISASLSENIFNDDFVLKYMVNSYELEKDAEARILEISREINQGFSATAQFIADKYYYGDDVIVKDQVKSMKIHNILFNHINGHEAFYIGKKYYQGSKYLKNTTIGLIYLNIAAFDKYFPAAFRFLGDLFYYGDSDTDKDKDKGLDFHEVSAELDWCFNIVDIGKKYYKGSEYLKKNTTVGLIYLNAAAFDRDSSDTLRFLGDLFYYGDSDTDKDEDKGLELHTMLANRINTSEALRIGRAYYEGLDYKSPVPFKKNTTIGFIYLNIAAFAKSSPKVLRYLGDLFYYGDNDTDKDQVKALEFHARSANRISAFENFRIGESYYEGLLYNSSVPFKKNATIGLIYLKTAYDKRSPEALRYLGDLFYYGDNDTDKDKVKALEFHARSANRINASEALRIGREYYEGLNYNSSVPFKKNATIGLIYLNIAAFDKSSPEAFDKSSPAALRYLGDLFYYGDSDTDKDKDKGLELHKTSAKLDWCFNIVDIGKKYYKGSEYLKKNTTIGLIYLNTAAFDRGSDDTLRYLGDLFYYGDSDSDKDNDKGLELHTKLANRITAFENFRIGESYYEGLCYGGFKYLKNTTIGLIYLNTAAFDKNSPAALRYLGDLFFNGDSNIGKDKVRAFELYKASEKRLLERNNTKGLNNVRLD